MIGPLKFIELLRDPNDDSVDPQAKRELGRFTIWSLLVLQFMAATILVVDLNWFQGAAFSSFMVPIMATLWVSCRLRYYPHVGWINPFSVGVLFVGLSIGIHTIINPSAAVIGDTIAFWAISSLALGLLLGFVCVNVAYLVLALTNNIGTACKKVIGVKRSDQIDDGD